MAGLHWLDALTPPLEKHLQQLASSIKAFLQITPRSHVTSVANEQLRREKRGNGRKVFAASIAAATVSASVLALVGVIHTTQLSHEVPTSVAPAQPTPGPQSPASSESSAPLRVLGGHTASVVSLAFSPDGHTLASGSDDDTIKLWDPVSGREIRTLTGHDGYVTSVTFSKNGQALAAASASGTIKIWNPTSGDLLDTVSGREEWFISIAFSPDGGSSPRAARTTVSRCGTLRPARRCTR